MFNIDKRICWILLVGFMILTLTQYCFQSDLVDLSQIKEKFQLIDRDDLSNETTIVTAYWNLGRFKKGRGSIYFDTDLYKNWTESFRYIYNPVIFYTDSEEFAKVMNDIRNLNNHRTKIFVVDRNSSWAFLNIDRTKRIFSIPGYPKHHPNTVVPEYTCAQIAKYDVTARAIWHNFYKTKYFAWMDIGYFRDRDSKQDFYMVKPANFNEYKIAMNEVFRRKNLTPSRIFKKNIVWLGGGLFFGRYDVILRHETQIKKAVDYFLDKQLMNTDQQVLYSMYSNEGLKNLQPETYVQTYWSNGDWNYLGKSMVREGVPDVKPISGLQT